MVDSVSGSRSNLLKISSDGRGQENESSPVVLIVDDDGESRLMLKFLLEIWKYRVVEAADEIEAFSVTEKIRPNLILMDLKMPNLDGFNITRKIRQSPAAETVPIVFLSGCAGENYKQKAAAAGGDEYLDKPLNFDQLEQTIGKYLSPPQ